MKRHTLRAGLILVTLALPMTGWAQSADGTSSGSHGGSGSSTSTDMPSGDRAGMPPADTRDTMGTPPGTTSDTSTTTRQRSHRAPNGDTSNTTDTSRTDNRSAPGGDSSP